MVEGVSIEGWPGEKACVGICICEGLAVAVAVAADARGGAGVGIGTVVSCLWSGNAAW